MISIPKIPIGESLTIQRKVTEEDTALNYGNGQLENLLATPSLVALMIEAGATLLDEHLPEGYITVGQMAQVIHEKPTVLGETVSVKVEVTAFDGNKVQLAMHAYDEMGLIGTGSHVRAVVNKQSLMARANQREVLLENHDF